MFEDFLLQVRKPAQYIGQEWNISKKDFNQADIKFALCFPDLYEVGMSNLGIRILYGILNNIPDVVCERLFSCANDFENILRSKKEKILSLESRKCLQDFDIVGFSLSSELGYTNVLNILDLSGINLKATIRDNSQPLIIGGGPCTLNPEPMHEFFDLFIIGEAEDAIVELVDLYRKNKTKYKNYKISKQDLLFLFSQIEGVYVPSFYETFYSPGGLIHEFKPKIRSIPVKIKKRFVKDLNSAHFPRNWLLPYIQIIHDRIILEIMRGCPNKCRFCQARSQYLPLRYRDINEVLSLAVETYRHTGYEEISLTGLSVSDYPKIEELLKKLIELFQEKAVAISLPSIKARVKVAEMSSMLANIKKTGLTFAPETGSERLRKVMAKEFNEEELFKILEQAYQSGYQHLKLYFMIGLPSETTEDLDAIINLATRVSDLRRKSKKAPAQVNLSINTLIPKPHTPFQWLAMEGLEGIKHKQDYLKARIKNNRLKLNFHNRYMSFLEGVLSRGDRRLSEVIFTVFREGAKFDAWGNHFSFEKWLNAFRHAGIDPDIYLQEKEKGELLAWDFLDIGISKEQIRNEAAKLDDELNN